MKVVGWFCPEKIFSKKQNKLFTLFKAILGNNEEHPYTISLICWNEKAYEVSKMIKYGMVNFSDKYLLD